MKTNTSEPAKGGPGLAWKMAGLRNDSQVSFLFVAAICWVANYTYFQGFGLYHDDWPAMADHAKLALWGGVDSPWAWFDIWPQGRPLGWFFLSALGTPGRYSGDLSCFYIVGYLILATVSVLIFQIVRVKYGTFLALLVSVLFLTSPADTTKIQLTMNYLAHTGFIFCLLAIILYQRGMLFLSYAASALPLICYEATFFPFLAAPLLTLPINSLSTWRRQVIHGLFCVLVVALVLSIRVWIFDSALASNSGYAQKGTFYVLFDGLYRYGLHFFVLVYNGVLTGLKTTGVVSVALATLILTSLYIAKRNFPAQNDDSPLIFADLAIVGFVLLMLGLVTSGFTDFYPGTPYGGRRTRVYIVAIFGGAMMLSALVPLVNSLLKSKKAALVTNSVIVSVVILGISGNAIKLQKDYVESWEVGRSVIRSSIELSCDAQPGNIIVLMPQEPVWDRGRAIDPYGFGFSTAIADIYTWDGTTLFTIPRIMKAKADWEKAIVSDGHGNLKWERPVLSGFPAFTTGAVAPDSIIYIKGTRRGLIRSNEPIVIDGINVIKKRDASIEGEQCWYRRQNLNGPLAPMIYPDLFAFSRRR